MGDERGTKPKKVETLVEIQSSREPYFSMKDREFHRYSIALYKSKVHYLEGT